MIVVTDSGETIDLGTVETAPTIGIIDYSRRVTDDFGVTTIVERGFARRMSVKLGVPFDDVDMLQRQLADLRATPANWIADDRFESLTVRGFYKDFALDLATSPLSYCTLTVEGLTVGSDFVDHGGDPAPVGQPSTLQLLAPITVTGAVFTSSSVDEADYPAWAASVSYPLGTRVIVAAAHRVYESATAANVGNDPVSTTGMWLDVGPTNRWAMVDQALGTATIAAAPIEVVLVPDVPTSALAVLDTNAATVRVRAPNYDRTQTPNRAGKVLFLDLAVAAGASVTVTVTPASANPGPSRWDDGAAWLDEGVWRDSLAAGDGTVTVGTLLIGSIMGLGVTEAAPTAGIIDYSRKVTDDFGEVTVVPRSWAKRMTANALIDTDALDLVAGRIAAVRARPVLWIGEVGLDSLTVYGFFKDFSIEVGVSVSKLSLAIEGLSQAAPIVPFAPGGSVAWPDITDPNGTKPTDNADKTSDNTSKDTAAVGGKPVSEVLATLDKIVPIETRFGPIEARFEPIESDISALELAKVGTDASLESLTRATVDQDAVLRQIERDAGRLDETLLRLLSESTRTRAVLRDAGIIVDPVTGIVRIYAVDQLADRTSRAELAIDGVNAKVTTKASVEYVNEKIALAVLDPVQAAQLEPIIARLTSAEQTIDGLNAVVALKAEAIELTRVSGSVTTVRQDLAALAGTVSTKAEKTVVDALGIRTGSVEQTLSTLGNVSGISVTIRQAQAAADGAATAALSGLLAGENADRRRIVAQSEVRQELYTKIVDGLSAEAVARTLLSVKIGDLDVRSVQETTARITGQTALGQRIDALGLVADGQAAAIATLTQASIGAGVGIAGIQTTIRQQSRDDDQSAEALLGALIAGEQAGQRRAAQLVQIQTEFTTTLVANEAASAVARQALLARMGAAEAAIVTTSKVLADTTQALTSRITAAEAVFNDAGTGLAATSARLVREESLRVSGDQANASDIATLSAQVNAPGTGLPATRATVAENKQAQLDGDSANARAVQQLSAQLFDAGGSVPAANARIDAEREARVAADSANARDTAILAAELHDGTTGLPATRATVASERQARIDGDTANATSVEQLSAQVFNPATGLPAANARIDAERDARVTADTANARDTSVLAAELHDAQTGLVATRATVASDRQARIDGDSANAKSVQQVAARLDGVGGVGVEQAISATTDRLGKIEGRYTVTVDANGNVSGFQLIGSDAGPGSLNLINTDLRMGTGRVIFNNGTFMQVQGVAFGVARDLLEWFGPTMPIAQCSRANAKIYKAIDGDAYFGGSLSAGVLRNASSSSGLSVSEVAQIGPFGSNGRPVKYVVSWSYRTTITATYAPTAQGLQQYNAAASGANAPSDGAGGNFGYKTVEQPGSSITLSRAFGGGSFAQIDQRSFTTQTSTFSGTAPSPGDAPGRADITTTIGGGFTVNDPVQSASDRTVKLTLARGFSASGDTVSQRLTIVATEE